MSDLVNKVSALSLGDYDTPMQRSSFQSRVREAVVGTTVLQVAVNNLVYANTLRPDLIDVTQTDVTLQIHSTYRGSAVVQEYTKGVSQRIEQLVNDNYDWILTGKQTS